MMAYAMLVTGIVLPVALAALFIFLRHWRREHYAGEELSAVSRQHIDLFQGGQLSESAVESAKCRFRSLLERGEEATVEASLRPGMHYVIQVRALTELGTDDAGRILERQLQRRLTSDQIEQSWYWIDLANGLRALNRQQSLPHLLRCAEAAGDIPLGHFFAAETVCFLGFAGYVRQPGTALGTAALRVLHRALEGLRYGVPPQIVVEGRLGELIEGLWDNRPEAVHPLAARVFAEALRLLRRAPHTEALLADERADQEAFHWQIARVAVLEPALEDYLQEAPRFLAAALPRAGRTDQRDILQALVDLRAETAGVLLSLLNREQCACPELAVEALRWSRDERVGSWLRVWTFRQVPMIRRAGRRRRAVPPRRPSVPADVPYQSVLRALRGHPSRETETFLLLAAHDWDPTFRAAAVSSLGWWEPLLGTQVLTALQEARHDANADVRQAARAALGRLGGRQALQWFRHCLTCEEPQRVHEAIQLVATEGLTLLWPDLDRLADAEEPAIANHARESLERLCEDLHGPLA
jgi:hypothetical protein